MLVLTRGLDEEIVIGNGTKLEENVRITIVDIRGDKVRLGIIAPTEVPIHRREVYEVIKQNVNEYNKIQGYGGL